DELAAWPRTTIAAAWSNLTFALRIGAHPRCVWSSTPKPIPLLHSLAKRAADGTGQVIITRGSTLENAANLSASFIEEIVNEYGSTRLGRQEIDGELLDDVIGALFSPSIIEAHRAKLPPSHELVRTVIGVDPAITAHGDSDETGIVIASLGEDKRIY